MSGGIRDRLLGLLLGIAIGWPVAAQEAAPMRLRAGLKIEDLGVAVQRRELAAGYIFENPITKDRQALLIISAGNGFEDDPLCQLVDFNLTTGAVRSCMNYGAYRAWLHPNGKLYLAGGRPASLVEYDPTAGKARLVGNLVDNFYHGAQSIDLASDGRLYIGHYGCHLTRYDPQTDKIEYLGLMGQPRNKYLYSLAAGERYVYCSMSDGWYLIVYDTQTGKQEAFPNLTGAAAHHANGTITYGNRLMQDGKVVPKDRVEAVKAAAKPVPRNSLMTWVDAEKAWHMEFDLSDMNPTRWNGGKVVLRWRPKDAKEWAAAAFAGVHVEPNPPSIMAPTPEGKIIGMGAHYGPLFIFDPDTGTSDLLALSPCSIDAMLVKKDVMYFTGYSSQFWIFDRAKPWTLRAKGVDYAAGAEPNPVNIGGAGKWPFRIAEGADGRIYAAGNYGRHLVGGEVMVYDPATRKRETTIRKEVEAYSIRDLCALDRGRLIVWSAVEREGEKAVTIFVYDAAERRIAQQRVFQIDARDPGQMMPAGNDSVLGVVRSSVKNDKGEDVPETLIYKLNVLTGEVLFQKKTPGRAFSGPLWSDFDATSREICRGPDGCGWLCIEKDLVRVHPDGTVEKALALPHGARLIFHGNDLYLYNGGRQFYGGFASIWRIRDVFEK